MPPASKTRTAIGAEAEAADAKSTQQSARLRPDRSAARDACAGVSTPRENRTCRAAIVTELIKISMPASVCGAAVCRAIHTGSPADSSPQHSVNAPQIAASVT
jgi:hypothetical protein